MGYRYFKPNEYISLNPELVFLLDSARGIAGIPFRITSGYRTKEQNAAVDGAPNSYHLQGRAADLACDNSINRAKIVDALFSAGICRVKIYNDHIHVDLPEDLKERRIIT